ncbi:MAG: hypothetical protein ACLP0A_16180 [Verrucomicrobiia bacterium]
MTDFDVLGVHFEPDFSCQIAVAECKSGDEQAMNFLLKLNGLRVFFNAYKAYLVQARIDSNAREVGRQTGIWCLDEANLEVLLRGCGVEEAHIQIERSAYAKKVELAESQKKAFPKSVEYLKYDFWTLPDHRNLVNLMRLFSLMAKKVDPKNHSDRVLTRQMAVNLALSVSQITADVLRHDVSDVPTGLLNRVLGGARERRDREALFDTISKLVPKEKLSITPDFYEPLTELVLRFVNAAREACSVVNCLDHFVRQELAPDFDKVWGSPEQNYGERTVKLARDVYHFVSRTNGIPLAALGIEATATNGQRLP